jgi:hypothetical protein
MLHNHKDHALVAFFLFLLSPLLWIVLSGETAGIGENNMGSWVILLTFTLTAYLAYLAVIATHKK